MSMNTELSIEPLGSRAIREPNHQWSEPPGSECSVIKGVSDLVYVYTLVMCLPGRSCEHLNITAHFSFKNDILLRKI